MGGIPPQKQQKSDESRKSQAKTENVVQKSDLFSVSLEKPQIHDFAVVWDEDHDTRVFSAIEQIYMEGLLSPVQFIGERKGTLTVIVAARFYFYGTDELIRSYKKKIYEIAQSLDDPWPSEVGSFDRSFGSEHQCFTEGLINAEDDRVLTYLRNIDSLWGLGTKDYKF